MNETSKKAGKAQQTPLASAGRIVIKIGSSLLVDAKTGTLRKNWMTGLARDIGQLRSGGADIVLVSSGAIALGRRMLNLPDGVLKLPESQAAAACGQIALAHAWQGVLSEQQQIIGQILLTLNDTEERRRYLNARATLFTLLEQGAIPLINENDTVATSEIRYGDNDRLAARMCSMVAGDCLVLLSDVDGLYSTRPGEPGARFIANVDKITANIEAMAGESATDVGSGGMITKIEAAKIATAAGANMVIADGKQDRPIKSILEGNRCTWFKASGTPVLARKRWIAGAVETAGTLHIDVGAINALNKGKSLLPAGVKRLDGKFLRGDTVLISGPDNEEIGRGLVGYDHTEAEKIIGCRSDQIEKKLGYAGRHAIVHRNDLVLKEN